MLPLAAVGLIALLLVGPRLVDAYANWLWFGEVGFRSVWVTVLLTRVAIFVAVALVVGGTVFLAPDACLSLAAGLCTRRAAERPDRAVPDPGDAPVAAVRVGRRGRCRCAVWSDRSVGVLGCTRA